MSRRLVLVASHALVGLLGLAAGVYLLPILTAPERPGAVELQAAAEGAQYRGTFRRDLADSDLLHWGEGTVHVGRTTISLQGRIAPGPDYKLYLSPEFVETEADFARVKPRMVRVGDVKTFENFVVAVPSGVDPDAHTAVIVWCETFGEFITAARYR